MTPAEKRLVITKRREQVAGLVASRHSPHQIADALRLPLSIVRQDIQVVDQIWLNQTKISMEIDKARQLARIDELEIKYRKAYERSCRPRKRKRTLKKTKMRKQKQGEVEVEVEGSDGGESLVESLSQASGDPRFLQGIEWCIAERNKLNGHYPRNDAPPASMPVMVIVGPQSNVQVNTPPLPITYKELPKRVVLENLLPPAFTFNEDMPPPIPVESEDGIDSIPI